MPGPAHVIAGRLTEHELQRWLERHTAELSRSNVTTVLGRGPTLCGQRGATWISFQSRRAIGRVVLHPSGDCHLTASRSADGGRRLDAWERCGSSARVDEVVSVLVGHLA